MRFYKDNHAQVIASKWNHFKVEKKHVKWNWMALKSQNKRVKT